MAEEFLDEEVELINLTHQQAALLSRFGRAKRMVVTGCAGSGKTMLAVEQAKRRVAQDKRVLFVCFNKALATHLKEREANSGVEFSTFHGLCVRLASIAEVELPKYGKGEAPQSYFAEDLPNALVKAATELGPMYDSIFVDEAQDLHNDWLTALACTLHDPDKGQLWLFMDDNQNVYDQRLDVPEDFQPFDLTWNCRNTQAIHREVMKKYKGEVVPEATGPEGRDAGADPQRRSADDGSRNPRAPLRQGGSPAAGRGGAFIPRLRELRGRPVEARALHVREGAAGRGGPVRAVLLHQGVQGPGVTGGGVV